MTKTLALLASLVALCGIVALTRADAAGEKMLKGTLACAKCVLHEEGATKCQSVLQVKEGDKTVKYYLADNETAQGAHPKVCHKAIEGVTVTGTVMEKDGKMWITASKIEWPKE